MQRAADEPEDAYHGRVYAAKGAVLGLAQSVGETIAAYRERVDAALGTATERYRGWRDQAGAAGSSMVERGQDTAQRLYDVAARRYRALMTMARTLPDGVSASFRTSRC